MQHPCNLAAKESRLECACVNNADFTVLVMGAVDTTEWACVLCGHCIQNDWASRAMNLHQILHKTWTFLCRNYSDDSEGPTIGKWWLTASSQQCACPCSMSHAEFFSKTSNYPGNSAPLKPRLGVLGHPTFPKTKITFDFRPLMRFRKIRRGSWWWLGKLCEVPRCLLSRGLRHHCPMYSVSYILYLLQ